MKFRFLLLALLIFSAACTKQAPTSDTSRVQTGDDNAGNGSSTSGQSEDTFLVFNNEARASVSTLSIGESTLVTGVKVPKIMLKKTKADFVKILRCKSTYQLRGPTGEMLQDLQTGPKALDNQGYVWSEAFGNLQYCQVVGVNIVDESPAIIEDLAAPTGDFYYVINPCVTQARSLNYREGCSNSLAVTQTIHFTSELTNDFLGLSKKLADAQDKVNAITTEGRLTINRLRNNLQACEDLIAHDNQMQLFYHGLMYVGLMIGFGIVGAAIGGATGALMGVMMGPMLTEQVLMIFEVPLPKGIENQCIAPAKPEERYQVFKIPELQKKITEIFAAGGTLSQAQAEVKVLLEKMHAIDERSMSIDQAIAKLKNRGVDMKNLSSVKNAIDQAQDIIKEPIPGASSGVSGGTNGEEEDTE